MPELTVTQLETRILDFWRDNRGAKQSPFIYEQYSECRKVRTLPFIEEYTNSAVVRFTAWCTAEHDVIIDCYVIRDLRTDDFAYYRCFAPLSQKFGKTYGFSLNVSVEDEPAQVKEPTPWERADCSAWDLLTPEIQTLACRMGLCSEKARESVAQEYLRVKAA